MRSNENYHYHQQQHVGIGASRRRLPFDSTSIRMSSTAALKRPVTNTSRYPQSNNHYEMFLNRSSESSSITGDEDDGEVKMLDETIPDRGLNESDKHKNLKTNNHNLSMNNHHSKSNIDGPMIQELLQSNMDLKKELRDIRRQIKHNGINKPRNDRAITATSNPNKNKTLDDNNCSFIPDEDDYYDESSPAASKLQQYKTEATVYKQKLDTCQDTIAQLRKTIDSMEKRIDQLRTVEHRQIANVSNQHENYSTTANNNNTDHRFIHELFHLCIKHIPRSSKLKNTVPSHQDMKTFIRQTFNDFIKTSPSSSKISANKAHDINHFVCKCSERIHTDHRPTYQFCLGVVEQCQSLFDVMCFTQLSTALNELYYRYGELTNFKRSIASTLGLTENSKLVSCPKLIKTLQQTLDDAKSNELITFKKMAKINDMNEAISKIRSYDDFVPYYHQFIEQMANLLEVSKGDEIMPAIKTLKLLAHSDSYRPRISSNNEQFHPLTRASSLNTCKNSNEKFLSHSKSLRALSTQLNTEQLNKIEKPNYDSEQQQTGTDDGDS